MGGGYAGSVGDNPPPAGRIQPFVMLRRGAIPPTPLLRKGGFLFPPIIPSFQLPPIRHSRPCTVIPAKAGIHCYPLQIGVSNRVGVDSRESGNDGTGMPEYGGGNVGESTAGMLVAWRDNPSPDGRTNTTFRDAGRGAIPPTPLLRKGGFLVGGRPPPIPPPSLRHSCRPSPLFPLSIPSFPRKRESTAAPYKPACLIV